MPLAQAGPAQAAIQSAAIFALQAHPGIRLSATKTRLVFELAVQRLPADAQRAGRLRDVAGAVVQGLFDGLARQGV